ncbi:ABC-three component system protein [Nocardia arizonensis]|uniref:ABC-three component system protein n=1 Tax=Nocardia arizonensis TaxID=1141647 RepID=UPI0006D0B3A0|nr:ABC-three component system protein [Nocardia arizonensis]
MFLVELASSDRRFKELRFHAGLNILVADRTAASEQGESRNSSGKTSFVKILRYLFGGDLPPEFRAPELSEHRFTARLRLPGQSSDEGDDVSVTRAVSSGGKVQVLGWSKTNGDIDLRVEDWKELLSRHVFGIPTGVSRPTSGQLWAQLIRTHFGNPIKGHHAESDWESGVKLGFMLGMSAEVLGRAGELDRLAKQSKAIRKAVQEGALAHLSLDESALRVSLATARRRRDRMREDLRAFKVDDRYAEHQKEADEFSRAIRKLNEEGLTLQRRLREIRDTLSDEVSDVQKADLTAKLGRVYAEVGLVLPDAVTRRYEDVAAFHESVLRNRRIFLERELAAVRSRLGDIDQERGTLDRQRAQIMQLLGETVALDTFLSAQRDLAQREAEVADIERRLDAAQSVSAIGDTIKLKTAELVTAVRAETHEHADKLDESIALFSELGAEIYSDREASLLVSPTSKGILSVEPRISGDASSGIRSVETFMLDMVCAVAAMRENRAPRILVHDSHLFDAIDGRQVASCLNIGARLAEEKGFQYIVSLNSDFLALVESQSDGLFDSMPYVLETRLTDETDTGGLFGFRFG